MTPEISGTERLLRQQAQRLDAEADAAQDAEDLRLVRVMRAIAAEEVDQVRASMLTRSDVSAGVAEGMRQLLRDEQLVKDFWSAGFRHLSERGSDSAIRWVGRRVLLTVAGMLLAASVYLAAKLGVLK